MAKPLSDNFPVGSVIIVDEALEIYPPRAAAAKMPVHIEGLNTLRHFGLTLILITQNPVYLDPFVKGLISKHIHVDRKQIGSRLYEWTSLQTSFNQHTFSQAYSEVYKPDKRVFGLYKSSAKHIKFEKSISWYWYLFFICPILLGVALYFFYDKLDAMSGKDDLRVSSAPAAVVAPPVASAPVSSFDGGGDFGGASVPAKEVVGGKVGDYVPRVDSLPETKPIYDNLRVPVNMETVAGCVKTVDTCNCYTEQGTKVYASHKNCVYWAQNGVFQVYRRVDSGSGGSGGGPAVGG